MGIEKLELDTMLRGRVMLALQKAIVEEFDQADWREIACLTGEHDYIIGHDRLIRSLGFGDKDYGGNVYQVLDHLSRNNKDALLVIIEHKKIRPYLERKSPDVLSDMGLGGSHVQIARPLLSTADTVRKALADADSLLRSNGASSAIDRLHTALHGYLRFECLRADIHVPDDSSITALFKELRTWHRAFQTPVAQEKEIRKVLMAFATVVDSLNTVRNLASMAHPNEEMLGEPEGELMLNVVRTLFNYLIRKVG